jgi:FkbM family methyltransferase
MSKILKKIASVLISGRIKDSLENYFNQKFRNSFSQEGEDLVLQRIFAGRDNGFFVDVGAHHPTRFSNTYLFYLKGWRGINIDAAPGSMAEFRKVRPGDINIECPVSDKSEIATFYIFNEPALNTFSESEAKKKNGLGPYRVIESKELQTETLSSILNKNLPHGKEIDFLSIDVEGLDLQVLKSNNWDLYKPKIILVEDLLQDFNLIIKNSEVKKYLEDKNYLLFAKTVNTVFYKLNQ